MSTIASEITSLTIVYSTVYPGADQRKHQSSASLAFVRGIHRGPVNSPHKGPVTRKMFPSDDVIMQSSVRKDSGEMMIMIKYSFHVSSAIYGRRLFNNLLQWLNRYFRLVYRIVDLVSCSKYYRYLIHTSDGIWPNRQPDCLSNSLFRLTTKKTLRLNITGPPVWEIHQS